MLLNLHKIITYLESVTQPAFLDKLKTDLAIDDEILDSCASYIMLQDGMITLNQNALDRVIWITPQILYNRDTQYLTCDTDNAPHLSIVRNKLMPLIQEQGLLVENMYLEETETGVICKIIYAPAMWCAHTRTLSFLAANKEPVDFIKLLSATQADNNWETWNCYKQVYHAATIKPWTLTSEKLQEIITLIQDQYHFKGIIYQIASHNKISTFIPYSTINSLYHIAEASYAFEEPTQKYFGIANTATLSKRLKIHNKTAKGAIESLSFLPKPLMLPDNSNLMVQSPIGVGSVEAAMRPVEEISLWRLLAPETENPGKLWICETTAGDLHMSRLVPNSAQKAFRSRLEELLLPNTPTLVESRSAYALTFFERAESPTKRVDFSPTLISTTLYEVDDYEISDIMATQPSNDEIDDDLMADAFEHGISF